MRISINHSIMSKSMTWILIITHCSSQLGLRKTKTHTDVGGRGGAGGGRKRGGRRGGGRRGGRGRGGRITDFHHTTLESSDIGRATININTTFELVNGLMNGSTTLLEGKRGPHAQVLSASVKTSWYCLK